MCSINSQSTGMSGPGRAMVVRNPCWHVRLQGAKEPMALWLSVTQGENRHLQSAAMRSAACAGQNWT